MLIPICVNAKNEQNNLESLLNSILKARTYAEMNSDLKFSITVVLDECTDNSYRICQSFGSKINVIQTKGGLVAAQRYFVSLFPDAKWSVFSDADIAVSKDSLLKLSEAMEKPNIQVAYLEKVPVPPLRRSLLAKALYQYNLNNGYQNDRQYFNGQFFAIRKWNIPEPKKMDFPEILDNSFLNLKAGVRCDDIYLSRMILFEFGQSAIECVDSILYYRPPETIKGMFRKYQRMVLEIERLNILFPATVPTHRRHGVRTRYWKKALRKGRKNFFYLLIFDFYLFLCKAKYFFDRNLSLIFGKEYKTWKTVKETKQPLFGS